MNVTIKGIRFAIDSPEIDAILASLTLLTSDVKKILKKENRIMGLLEDAKTKIQEGIDSIAALNTALDGYRDLVAQMKAELESLKSGAVLAPAVEAKVSELIALADAETADIKATFDENFPQPANPSEPVA